MAITVERICLAQLELEVNPENVGSLSFNIAVSCQSEYPEPNHLVQVMEFDLAHEVKDAPFVFKFTFVSVFHSDGEGVPTLQEFAEANAPAYVMPYARELIANITSRLGIIPTLVLPPINVFKLVEDARDSAEGKSQHDEDVKPDVGP